MNERGQLPTVCGTARDCSHRADGQEEDKDNETAHMNEDRPPQLGYLLETLKEVQKNPTCRNADLMGVRYSLDNCILIF